jgi:hypothetical protein
MMNDETEQFESRLSRQPLREIPSKWRGEILAAANSPAWRSEAGPASFFSTLNQQLSTLLWPHPRAWAGLAAVWVLILAVDFSMRDTSPRIANKSLPPSPEVIVELKKQQLLLAELMGSREPLDADRQKSFAPKPRSERAEILMT